MLEYGGCVDQDMNNMRVDQITGSQNVVQGIVEYAEFSIK